MSKFLLVTVFNAVFAGNLVASNSASLTISCRVDPSALVSITKSGVNTGSNRSYVTSHEGIVTVEGDGLVWTTNIPRVKITAHTDGGIPGLTVNAVNITGGRSSGVAILGDAEQDVIAQISPGIGSSFLDYNVPTGANGSATVVFTITSCE